MVLTGFSEKLGFTIQLMTEQKVVIVSHLFYGVDVLAILLTSSGKSLNIQASVMASKMQ